MGSILFLNILVLLVLNCFSQEETRKPVFPNVFQTEIQGTFINVDEVAELDGVLYYDRDKNRAAYRYTYKGETTSSIYNFNNDEIISIDDNYNCVVEKIPEEPERSFFLFTVENGKKKLVGPDEILFFTKSVQDTEEYSLLPALIYKAKLNISQYQRNNCDIIHIFSKTSLELPTCKEDAACEPTLMTINVKCPNPDGSIGVDHSYSFFRFKKGTVDESAFLPSAGVYCAMKSVRELPPFPSYFSFTFDVVEKPISDDYFLFSTHKKVWYDSNYQIIRIDEFGFSGLLYSSRILDVKSATAFAKIATTPVCEMGPIGSEVPFDEITRLPKAFFTLNDSTANSAVYVGKRTVHGLEYNVWTLMWMDSNSEARIIEEIHYIEIVPNEQLQLVKDTKPQLQISHVDIYTYEMNDISRNYELTLLKHLSINNFRDKPKEWAAFDVAACFTNNKRKDFSLKIEGPSLIEGSLSYRKVIELLYNNIVAATGVSILRISELKGVFNGVSLVEVRGTILDNSDNTGWQKKGELGAEETFKLIEEAASEGKLSITFTREDDQISHFNVTLVEEIVPEAVSNSCYAGGSMAIASLVMLMIGIFFGIVGYYVFLKKRKKSGDSLALKEMKK